jgi:predicted aspartyl protease
VGTFFHPITLTGPNGERVTLDALVDRGATFTSVPEDVLSGLQVEPSRRARLRLADGSLQVQALGEVAAEIDGEEVQTIVVFGPPDSPPAIGAYTLEGLLLGVDPIEQKLVPIEGWWARRDS